MRLTMIHVTHINDTSKTLMISATYPPPPSPPWVIHGMYLPCIASRDAALDTQTTHTEIFLNFSIFLDTMAQKDYILLLRSHKTMKLTESMLRKIIKEELKKTLKESSRYWPEGEDLEGGDTSHLNQELLDMLVTLEEMGKDSVPVEVVAQKLGISPQQVVADVKAAIDAGEFWLDYPYESYDGQTSDPSRIGLSSPQAW